MIPTTRLLPLRRATKVFVHTDTIALVALLNQLSAQQELLLVDLELEHLLIVLIASRGTIAATQRQVPNAQQAPTVQLSLLINL